MYCDDITVDGAIVSGSNRKCHSALYVSVRWGRIYFMVGAEFRLITRVFCIKAYQFSVTNEKEKKKRRGLFLITSSQRVPAVSWNTIWVINEDIFTCFITNWFQIYSRPIFWGCFCGSTFLGLTRNWQCHVRTFQSYRQNMQYTFWYNRERERETTWNGTSELYAWKASKNATPLVSVLTTVFEVVGSDAPTPSPLLMTKPL